MCSRTLRQIRVSAGQRQWGDPNMKHVLRWMTSALLGLAVMACAAPDFSSASAGPVTVYVVRHVGIDFDTIILPPGEQTKDFEYLKVMAQSAATRSPRRSVHTRIGEFNLVRNWLNFLRIV